jgi:hypothetical protein
MLHILEHGLVVVERNKTWFNANVSEIKKIWDLIQIEKETGFEHRQPKKRGIIRT